MTKKNYSTQEKKIKVFSAQFGAVEESRTPTPVKVLDPESSASANSATTAHGYFTIKAVSRMDFLRIFTNHSSIKRCSG